MPEPRVVFFWTRLVIYAAVVAYMTSYFTYVTTYLRPDRPFTFDHVLFVFLIGVAAFIVLGSTEAAFQTDLNSKYVFAVLSLFMVLTFVVRMQHLVHVPQSMDCGHSYAYVVHAESSDHDAELIKREFPSVPFSVWKSTTPASNLTAELGVDFHEDHILYQSQLTHLVSTYQMLNHYYASSPFDWIVVLESNSDSSARALPDFEARVRYATCTQPDADVIWLQGPAAIRWMITGGIVDGTVGMIYKRRSVPRILEWMDLDNQDARQYEERDHVDEGYQLYALNHLLSSACWRKKLTCAASAAVVEHTKRDVMVHP